MNKQRALAEYLEIDPEDVRHEFGDTYDTPEGEYLVFSSYDDAYDAAIESMESLLDDIGIEGIRFNNLPGGMEAYVNTDWFYEAMRESYDFYIDDIRNEWDDDEHTRLDHEMEDAGVDSEYEFLNYLCDQWDDPVEWFIDNFGKSEFSSTAREKGLFDYNKLAKAIVDTDGLGICLSSYDGNEIDYDGYYMFRIN